MTCKPEYDVEVAEDTGPSLDELYAFVLAGWVAVRGLESLRLVESALTARGRLGHRSPPLGRGELEELGSYLLERVVHRDTVPGAVGDPRMLRGLLALCIETQARLSSDL